MDSLVKTMIIRVYCEGQLNRRRRKAVAKVLVEWTHCKIVNHGNSKALSWWDIIVPLGVRFSYDFQQEANKINQSAKGAIDRVLNSSY